MHSIALSSEPSDEGCTMAVIEAFVTVDWKEKILVIYSSKDFQLTHRSKEPTGQKQQWLPQSKPFYQQKKVA